LVPEGDPPRTKTLYWPSDSAPLDVVRVCVVPDNVIAPTPFVRRSMMLMLSFTVVPHVADCSPFAGSSMPPFAVYVLGMICPYAAILVHVVLGSGVTFDQFVPGSGIILPHTRA